jgi:hypothetical protein
VRGRQHEFRLRGQNPRPATLENVGKTSVRQGLFLTTKCVLLWKNRTYKSLPFTSPSYLMLEKLEISSSLSARPCFSLGKKNIYLLTLAHPPASLLAHLSKGVAPCHPPIGVWVHNQDPRRWIIIPKLPWASSKLYGDSILTCVSQTTPKVYWRTVASLASTFQESRVGQSFLKHQTWALHWVWWYDCI